MTYEQNLINDLWLIKSKTWEERKILWSIPVVQAPFVEEDPQWFPQTSPETFLPGHQADRRTTHHLSFLQALFHLLPVGEQKRQNIKNRALQIPKTFTFLVSFRSLIWLIVKMNWLKSRALHLYGRAISNLSQLLIKLSIFLWGFWNNFCAL